MKISNFRFLVWSISFFLLLGWGVKVQAQAPGKNRTEQVPTVLFFGDSIMDTGNNNRLFTYTRANFPPYGRDFVGKKATGRFSNAKVIPDLIASYVGLKEYVPSYLNTNLTAEDLLTGVSFASGGTGFDPVTTVISGTISMQRELEMFKEYKKKLVAAVGESKASSVIAKAVYVICAGSNDVVQYFSLNNSAEKLNLTQYSERLKEIATQYVKDLYKLGGRRFAIVSLPPVGCVPFQRTIAGGSNRTCAANRNKFALMYNSELAAAINQLKSTNELPGSMFAFVNIYPMLLELVEHPEKHGFKESTKGCCGTGLIEVGVLCNSLSKTCTNASEYVFWDSYHPTQRAYEVIVGDIIEEALAALN